MDIRDAEISKHGDIRSSSVVILPSGDALEGAVVVVWDGICDEKLRSQNLRRTTGLRAAHRSVLPPRRPNIVYVCYNASAAKSGLQRQLPKDSSIWNTFLSSAANYVQCANSTNKNLTLGQIRPFELPSGNRRPRRTTTFILLVCLNQAPQQHITQDVHYSPNFAKSQKNWLEGGLFYDRNSCADRYCTIANVLSTYRNMATKCRYAALNLAMVKS
jgi:hypothetical protein